MAQPVNPRSVVLNLVRVTQRSVSVRHLLAIGSLFGFNANAVRVAVARLVADGRLESDERGSYRLAPAAAIVHEHVEEWRRGESRLRPWRGEWLAAALPTGTARATRRTSLGALARLGLREGLPGVWVRPDNLRQPFESTADRLRALGLEDGAELFRARDFGARTIERFTSDLWPLRGLQRGYAGALRNLERSLEQLPCMPRETALVQSYLLGGEAIRVLATDPLLPEQIMPGETRAALTEAMLNYDTVGHALWRDFAGKPELSVVQGGRRRAG
jgi:phenylacetic acid degradation operon negative regulatory protein